ncbi:MAG: prepilin-type N-terminal cleavage/methylation domain-containing protein [Chthoniobacterales bacterium]|nr:prepilin-type N-terminal cleavage/methylation domain-containing protein [Chthoniobacterales bacterium]
MELSDQMSRQQREGRGFTLVEILIAAAVVAALGGVGVVAVGGLRESAREARLKNDVAVLNNGIDAYRASGGVIPENATPAEVLAKLKTVASPDSTAMGFPGPFIDPGLQMALQNAEEAASEAWRADYPDNSGYFYVRRGGDPGIRDFVNGPASPLLTELRQGPMPHTPTGEYLTAYTDRPALAPASAAAPQAIAVQDEAARKEKDKVKLPKGQFLQRTDGSSGGYAVYNGEQLVLTNYPLEIRVASDFALPKYTVQVSVNGGQFQNLADPYVIRNLDPETVVVAKFKSTDTSRYVDSDPFASTLRARPVSVTPIFPASDAIPPQMTYAQAGGQMVGVTPVVRSPIVVRLENIDQVPAKYRSSNYLQALYTRTTTARYTDVQAVATNAAFSAPTFTPVTNSIDVAGFGASKRIRFFASVQSLQPDFLVAADPLDKTTEIQTTPLTVEILPLKPIGLPQTNNVSIQIVGSYPTNPSARIFYTSTPGNAGSAPLNPVSGGTNTSANQPSLYTDKTYTIVAQATGPLGTEHWFTCEPVSRTYIAITTVPLKYVGLNMYKANIGGTVKGSIYMQAGDFAVLNAGAVVEGNVYLPGLPQVFLPGAGGLVAQKGKAYNQANDAGIDTNRITGREYTTEGVLADPQADRRKIVDLYGTNTTSNYEFRATETSRVDGKVYRRADPPPVSTNKPGLPSGIALSNAAVTVTGTNTLAAGSYALTLANTNSVLRMGSPGTLTSYVFGAGSTWTGGKVEILGPVQVYFNSAVSMSGITFGSSNTIYQTGFVVMSNYSFSIGSGATVYGQVEARDSTISVGNGGAFYGSAFASEVAVSGNGYIDVSGGSDTNSVTSTNTP